MCPKWSDWSDKFPTSCLEMNVENNVFYAMVCSEQEKKIHSVLSFSTTSRDLKRLKQSNVFSYVESCRKKYSFFAIISVLKNKFTAKYFLCPMLCVKEY